MTHTIKSLRQNGYKVRVMHSRVYEKPNYDLKAKGGLTEIEITTPDKTQTVKGSAKCSDVDCYSRKIGNNIALGRALKQLNLE
jgi:hypothetical protein